MKLEVPFSKLELREIIRKSIWLSLLFVAFTSLITTQQVDNRREEDYIENAFVITKSYYSNLELAFSKEMIPFYFYGFLFFFSVLFICKITHFKEEDYAKEIHSYSHKIKMIYKKRPILFNVLLGIIMLLSVTKLEQREFHPFFYFLSFSSFIFLIRKIKILEIIALSIILLYIIKIKLI